MTFLEILARNRIRFFKSGTHGEIRICCPFCGETEYHFNINVHNGKGHCWHASCGYKSRFAARQVLKQLRINSRTLSMIEELEEPDEQIIDLPSDFQPLTRVTDEIDQQALDYLLHDRRITKAQIKRHHIGVSYCGRYAYRIIVPVYDGDKLRAIVARDFTGRRKPKYLNSKGDKYLWGFNPEHRSCVLAEGVFKAMRIELAGFPAAALLGHDLTPLQFEQIRDSNLEEIVLFPDPDSVGRRGVVAIAQTLRESWDGTVKIVWPVVTPADEMELSEIQDVDVHLFNWRSSRLVTRG